MILSISFIGFERVRAMLNFDYDVADRLSIPFYGFLEQLELELVQELVQVVLSIPFYGFTPISGMLLPRL